MEAICRHAIRIGLDEIALTDHFELYPPGFPDPDPYFQASLLDDYEAEVRRVQVQFKGRLRVVLGIEMGQPHEDLALSSKLVSSHGFDYVLGSIHKLRDKDLGVVSYEDETELSTRILEDLTALWELADKADYDCLAHVDIIRRYAAYYGRPIDFMDYPDALTRLLRRVIERGKGLEINTSGLRQPVRATLPFTEVLRLYRSLGGEIVTLGSDAHGLDDIGAGFSIAREALIEAGFCHIARYRNRTPIFCPI